jgi:hypothetical protein
MGQPPHRSIVAAGVSPRKRVPGAVALLSCRAAANRKGLRFHKPLHHWRARLAHHRAKVDEETVLYQRVEGDVRRAVVRRFPYSLFFLAMTSRFSTCLPLSRTPMTQPEAPGSSMKREDESERGSPVPRATGKGLIAPALRTRRDS